MLHYSISAQTNFAVGAVLNASFGSIVELILYETALVKDIAMKTVCYNHLVKAALIGSWVLDDLRVSQLMEPYFNNNNDKHGTTLGELLNYKYIYTGVTVERTLKRVTFVIMFPVTHCMHKPT